MQNRGSGSLQAEIGAIAAHAGVIGKSISVAAEVELIIGLIEVANTEDELGFVVALESGARGDVENAVGAIAVVGGVAATLRLKSINILGIDLRAEVAGDIRVGNRNTVDQPARLMAAANMQLIVDDVSTGHIVRDQGHAVGP